MVDCEDLTLVGSSHNGYHIYISQAFADTGEVIDYDNSFQKTADGAPCLLGALPVLLWFTSGTLEIFIIDGLSKCVKHALTIDIFDTKGFNFQESREYGYR